MVNPDRGMPKNEAKIAEPSRRMFPIWETCHGSACRRHPHLGQNLHCHSCPTRRSRTVRELERFSGVVGSRCGTRSFERHRTCGIGRPTIHELQKERGMSAGFVASKGQQFSAELPSQRQASDGRMRAFQDAVGGFQAHGAVATALDVAARELKQVEALRKSVLGLAVPAGTPPPLTPNYRIAPVGRRGIGGLSNNASIIQAASIYTATMRGKEQAGQERATGARGFGAGKFSFNDLRAFISLAAGQEEQFGVVRRLGTPAQQQALQTALSGAAGKEVAQMRDVALKNAVGESTESVTAPNWLKTATDRIDDLKKAEDAFARDLRSSNRGQQPGELHADHDACGLDRPDPARLGDRLVQRPFDHDASGRLLGITLALAEGKTDVDIVDADRGDEIGNLSSAVVVFRDNAIERQRLEEEAKRAQLAREERQRKVDALIERFRNSVGQTLDAVGENTAMMDSTAKTLTDIANSASGQATGAASASEEASPMSRVSRRRPSSSRRRSARSECRSSAPARSRGARSKWRIR